MHHPYSPVGTASDYSFCLCNFLLTYLAIVLLLGIMWMVPMHSIAGWLARRWIECAVHPTQYPPQHQSWYLYLRSQVLSTFQSELSNFDDEDSAKVFVDSFFVPLSVWIWEVMTPGALCCLVDNGTPAVATMLRVLHFQPGESKQIDLRPDRAQHHVFCLERQCLLPPLCLPSCYAKTSTAGPPFIPTRFLPCDILE